MFLSSLTVYILVFTILSLKCISADKTSCSCENHGTRIYDFVNVGQSNEIRCCVPGMPEDPEAIINWTFQGRPIGESMLEKFDIQCNNRLLLLRSATMNLEGNYTCTITNKDGTTGSFTKELDIIPFQPYREKPKEVTVSEDKIYASEGDSAKFVCSGIVGENSMPPKMLWTYVSPLGIRTGLPEGVNNNGTKFNRYTLTGTIEIKNITEEHFGTYICTVRNIFGATSSDGTLVHELSPPPKKANDKKTFFILEFLNWVMALANVLGS